MRTVRPVGDDLAPFSKLEALSAIRDDRRLDAKERIVLVMLLSHADRKGQCYPSMPRLADETGLSLRSVASAIRSLRKRGVDSPVRVVAVPSSMVPYQGGRPPNLYTLSLGTLVHHLHETTPGNHAPVARKGGSQPEGGFVQKVGGVSCKTGGGFHAPVALEAGHEAGHEAVHTPSRPSAPVSSAQFELVAEQKAEPSKPKRRAAKKPRAPKKPKKAERVRTEAETKAHGRVVEFYFEAFEQKTKRRPVFQGREGKSVWKLLDAIHPRGSSERAVEIIRNAMANEFGGTTCINVIANYPNKYAAPPRTNGKVLVQGADTTREGILAIAARSGVRVIGSESAPSRSPHNNTRNGEAPR